MRAIMAHSGFRPHVTLAARSALYHTGPVITVIAVFSSQIDRETHIYLATTERLNAAQLGHLGYTYTLRAVCWRVLEKLKLYVVVPCSWDLVDQPWLSIILLKTHYATCYATRLDFLVDHVTRTWSRSYMDKGRDCLEPASQDERQGKFLVLPFELINHRVKERALLQLESMRAPFFFIIYLPTLTNPAILIERIIPLIIWCSTKLDSFQFIIIVLRFLAPLLCFP